MTYARETLTFEVPTLEELGIMQSSDNIWATPVGGQTEGFVGFRVLVQRRDDGSVLVEVLSDSVEVYANLYPSLDVAAVALRLMSGNYYDDSPVYD